MRPHASLIKMNSNRQILGLDVVRGFAALIVMSYHLCFWISKGAIVYRDNGQIMNYSWLAPYTWFGWIGVEIFFVLSGFVISYSAATNTPVRFARGRIVRLYPSAWLCAPITFILLCALHIPHPTIAQLVRSIFLVPGNDFVDPSYWTLPVELSFYGLIFIVLLLRAFSRLEYFVGALALYSAAFNFYSWSFMFGGLCSKTSRLAGLISTPHYNTRIILTLARHGVFFALGALLWLVLCDRPTLLRGAGILLCTAGAAFEIIVRSTLITSSASVHYSWITPVLVWLASVAVIIASVWLNSSFAARLSPRSMSAIRKVGLMTYPLYLVHQRVGYALIGRIRPFVGDLAALVLTVLSMVALSYFIVTSLEKPVARFIRQVMGGGRKDQRVPASSLP